jgi:Zn-finger in Ran binding protein and others
MKCPSCGYDNRENAPYCDICQTPFTPPQADTPVVISAPASQPLQPDDSLVETEELNYYQHQVN